MKLSASSKAQVKTVTACLALSEDATFGTNSPDCLFMVPPGNCGSAVRYQGESAERDKKAAQIRQQSQAPKQALQASNAATKFMLHFSV